MQDKDGVDKLKDKLYSRKHQGPMEDVRSPLSESDAHVPVAWEPPPPPPATAERQVFRGGMDTAKAKGGMAFSTKFFLVSLAFFAVASIAAGYWFLAGGNFVSPQNIDLEIVAPSLVDGGSQVDLQVIITNRNQAPLKLADLVINYPTGTRVPNDPEKPLQTDRQSVGTIAPGQSVKRTASALFFGAEGSTQEVKVSLEYSIEGSNAVFVRDGSVSFTVGSSPVSVSVKAPETATAGQPFTFDVTVQSNTQEPINDVALEAQYPFGFTVQSTEPKADSGSTIWRLGTLRPGASTVVRITGTIDGQDGDERVFRFLTGSESDTTAVRIKVPFLNIPTSITVTRPFISGQIAIAGKTGSTVSINSGQNIQGSVSWKNNLSEPVSNLEIELELKGPVLDMNSVQTPNGFYQSSDNTIIWTSAQDPNLVQVAPGASGSFSFSFATLPPGTGGIVYTNPKISMTLNIKGTRGSDQAQQVVSAIASTDAVVGSLLSLEAVSLYSQGPYSNSGPTPPRAETPTTYTVRWTVKNSSNAIAGASVSAVLPPYVIYKTGGTGITYDAPSRTVRWDLGELKAGTGYTSQASAGSFQVTLNPSLSQVGQAPALTGTALLTGQDRYAQIQVQAQAQGPTTETADRKDGIVETK